MEITKLDKQLFKNIGSDNANPKNNLRRAVNSITTDSMPQSDSIRFTPHLKDCLKEVDKAVTAHCDTGAKKTDIGLFPSPLLDNIFKLKKGFGTDPEYRVVNYFYNMDTLHNAGCKIANLPWGYKEKRDKFFDAAKDIRYGGFGKAALRALKSFLGAAVAAAICLLGYLAVDGRFAEFFERLDGGNLLVTLLMIFVDFAIRFGGWFVVIIAAIVALVMFISGLVTLIGGLAIGEKMRSRRQLAETYVDVMRFIRVRMLWFQSIYDTASAPMFLAEAEEEILQRAWGVRKFLKRQLGANWLASPKKYSITKVQPHSERNGIPHEIDPKVKALMEDDNFTPRFTEIEAANYLAISAQKLDNTAEAIAYFRIAADAGSAHGAWAAAQLYLAEWKSLCEQTPRFAGTREKRFVSDLEEAEKLARKAKELGRAMADELLEEIWLKLAHTYDKQAEDAKDKLTTKLLNEGKSIAEAFSLCAEDETVHTIYAKAGRAHRALSDTGHDYSTYWIAVYLCQKATTLDEALEACHWIGTLSSAGHRDAKSVQNWYSRPLNALAAKWYNEGRSKDASKIFLALANAGVGQGMYNLAFYYSKQSGKIDEAIHWAQKALEKGEPQSEMLLYQLKGMKILTSRR